MLWFIHTTSVCNLRCKYCGGSLPASHAPPLPRYSVEELVDFIERNDPSPIVFFYGGEPLLNTRLIEAVMDSLGNKALYGIQTNATLYRRLSEDYWARFTTVLLSIDGRESITDYWRGVGVYERVTEALLYLRGVRARRGGPSRIIARMTATHTTNIYIDVMHLLQGLGFDKVHWQLNVVWSREWDLRGWADNSYLPGLVRLARWVSKRVEARLEKIVPFHGIVSALYNGGFNWPPCGAGKDAFAINTDGRILACPIAVSEKWATLGSLRQGYRPSSSSLLPEECRKCPYFPLCGGRCLYAQLERSYWSPRGLMEIEYVTKKTINIVLRYVTPAVEKSIEEGKLSLRELSYDPLVESTEVVP